jgi:hypothetical protein
MVCETVCQHEVRRHQLPDVRFLHSKIQEMSVVGWPSTGHYFCLLNL